MNPASLDDRYTSVLRNMDRLRAERSALVKRERQLEEEVESNEEQGRILIKVEELFKFLLDKYVHRYAESFSEVVTEGLQAIFHDQDIAFELVVGQKNGKVWIDFETVQDGVRGQALQSFGGGVSSVESFLLRLLVLLKTGLSKYLILDESLAALSEEYVDEAGLFIRRMSEELGVHVLLITHNKAFLDHAHTAYQADQDLTGERDRLTLKKMASKHKET